MTSSADRIAMFRAIAERHPGSFAFMNGAIFYGVTALFYDVVTMIGWGPPTAWPSRLLAAGVYGCAALWYARRAKSKEAS